MMGNFSKLPGSLNFSRSDRRTGGTNLARLDRFHIGECLANRGGSLGIMSGSAFSDHFPVIMNFFGSKKRSQEKVRIPATMLVDEKWAEEVHRIWLSFQGTPNGPAHNLLLWIEALSNFFQEIAIKDKEKLKEKELALRRNLKSLQKLQERFPYCTWTAQKLGEARKQLQQVQDKRSALRFHSQASRWAQFGDRVNGDFFKAKGPRNVSHSLQQLSRENGSITTDETEMRGIATRYYQNLFTQEPPTVSNNDCRARIWQHVREIIPGSVRGELKNPLSKAELLEAIEALSNYSCPGTDGIIPCFYRHYWDLMGDDISEAFQEMFLAGEMPETISEGMIFLIPKGDRNLEDIKQWRPITLLNTIYKIFAKALALRLQPILNEVIHVTQTGFIGERSIFDNLFIFWESMAAARHSHESLAIILLDFEKAYDRVDWDFLHGTLLRLGFPKEWVNGVSALYKTAHSMCS